MTPTPEAPDGDGWTISNDLIQVAWDPAGETITVHHSDGRVTTHTIYDGPATISLTEDQP